MVHTLHATLTSKCPVSMHSFYFFETASELAKIAWARGISEAAAFNIGTGCDSGSANRRRICVDMVSNSKLRHEHAMLRDS